MMNDKLLLSFLLLIVGFLTAGAQRPEPDRIKTNQGELVIQPILHGTLVLQWDGKTIYVDPYGGAAAFNGITAPDLILITDIHGDHLNAKTIESLETSKATIVTCSAVAKQLPDNLKSQVVVISNGESTTQSGISIRAIPMYNLPETEDSRHTKGRGNGYILELGGKTIYISGDTEDIPEMRALKNIDVAFICMNLPYTMDINQAADAVLAFMPKIVYPYHYRGSNGLNDVEGFKRLVNDSNKEIEVRLRNWYPTY